jgi:hypothetical protein
MTILEAALVGTWTVSISGISRQARNGTSCVIDGLQLRVRMEKQML